MREGLQKIVSLEETIVAVSTPAGRSALGVVRISGARARQIANRLFTSASAVGHRRVAIGNWLDGAGEVLDQVVVTFGEGPHSYTGEDLVEICGYGNPFILQRILQSAVDAGARLAMPGEFTLRSVAHGKIDLMQAEAIRDFIEAQTEEQARTLLRQVEGASS